MKFKVMTFNIQHGRNHNLSGDVIDLFAVANSIKDQNPDIVGLNEVRKGSQHDHSSGYSDQSKYLSEQLSMNGVFGKAIQLNDGTLYGNTIFSKMPMEGYEVVAIPDPPIKTAGYYYETRCLIKSEYIIDGKKLTILNSHFGLAPEEQTNAVDLVLDICKEIDNPVILMGDFNMTPDYSNIKRLSQVFTDCHRLLGDDMYTYPSHDPRERIDYIFCKDLNVISVDTVVSIISDHYAITAELEI